jgi:flagellar motor protein MotB
MSNSVLQTSGVAQRSRRAIGSKSRYQASTHGRWKLVYADFVTVLMAFFIVVWLQTYDLISKERKTDRTCTEKIALDVKTILSQRTDVISGREPVKVENDFMVPGVRFTLVDSTSPMFQSGSARLSAFAQPWLDIIAEAVLKCPADHQLRIEGYTDGTQYAGGAQGYGNWELSAERANSARRELIRRNIDSSRISEVTGYGDSRPALPDDPRSPLNRRISITVLAPYETGESFYNAR